MYTALDLPVCLLCASTVSLCISEDDREQFDITHLTEEKNLSPERVNGFCGPSDN